MAWYLVALGLYIHYNSRLETHSARGVRFGLRLTGISQSLEGLESLSGSSMESRNPRHGQHRQLHRSHDRSLDRNQKHFWPAWPPSAVSCVSCESEDEKSRNSWSKADIVLKFHFNSSQTSYTFRFELVLAHKMSNFTPEKSTATATAT